MNSMDVLHFEGRDVPPYGDYVDPETLVEGAVYFRLHYLDDRLTVPELEPLVFIGRNLEDGDTDYLYFQDAGSHFGGARYPGESSEDGTRNELEIEVHRVSSSTPLVYEFDKALDRLLYCSLTRNQG
jgi:hypothetical protein